MGWLGTWAKRIEITVDNTKIDSDLTHFAPAIALGKSVGQSNQDNTCVFDEVGLDYLKIAITKTDGTTQIYGDIEFWDSSSDSSGSKGTPDATRDLGSSDDGNAGLSSYGSPIDNLTYYTFDGSSIGLYNSSDLGDSSTEVCWAKVRIHDKAKGTAQVIWKDGGYGNGVAVGIDALGNLGIFGKPTCSLTIPSTDYDNDVWYDIYFTHTRVTILESGTSNIVATASGSCLPGNGSASESVGYVTSQSPITGATGSNIEFFDGDIADIEIYSDGDLTAPASGEEAVIHVAKSDLDILAASTTTLYIYYDSTQSDNTTYISLSGGTAAQSVWDNHFKLVLHMSQDPSGSTPQMLDSTSNNNDGTSGGSMTSSDLVDGAMIGRGLHFDGNDYITIPADASLKFDTGDFCLEAIFKTVRSAQQSIIDYGDRYNSKGWYALLRGTTYYSAGIIDDGSTQVIADIGESGNDNLLHTYGASFDRDANVDIYIDSVLKDTTDISGASGDLDTTDNDDIKIGRSWYQASFANYFVGVISEVRISDIVRSAAWLKATHYALIDDLLIYGSEESIGAPPVVDPQPIITILT